jgi:hypothetical protein
VSINKQEVQLTFKKEAGRLLRKGVYLAALLSLDKQTVLEPAKTLSLPEYETTIKIVVLGEAFIEHCLEKLPARIAMNPKKWVKLPQKSRIEYHAREMAHDYGYFLSNVEFLD